MDATRAIQAAVVRADMFISEFAKCGRLVITVLLTTCLWAAWLAFLKKKGWFQ